MSRLSCTNPGSQSEEGARKEALNAACLTLQAIFNFKKDTTYLFEEKMMIR